MLAVTLECNRSFITAFHEKLFFSTRTDIKAFSHMISLGSLEAPLPVASSSLTTRMNRCMTVDFYSMVTRLAPVRLADYWRECIQPSGEHDFFSDNVIIWLDLPP